MVVLGIADATEYQETEDHELPNGSANGYTGREELGTISARLHEQYPKVLLTQLLLFDDARNADHEWVPQGAICVPPVEHSKLTTMKTIMCDISAKLLAEMATYARAVQALPSVQSPGTSQSAPNQRTMELRPQIQRQSSLRSQDSRSGSPVPTHLPSRSVSQPQGISSATPTDSSPTTSPTTEARVPPTSFDDIANAAVSSGLSRSTSRASQKEEGRAVSRDRSSMYGSVSSSSAAERARNKGKARVGIVIGSLYLMAGRWSDAWRELVENTSKARNNVDYLWYAKGLENLLACTLLLAWAGFDFQIPAILQPSPERPTSLYLANGVKDSQTHHLAPDPETARQAAQRLANILPHVVNMIISYYDRAAYSSGETLPQLAYSESILRLIKPLGFLQSSAGELTQDLLRSVVQGVPMKRSPSKVSAAVSQTALSRHAIADLLFRAYPTPGPNIVLTDTVTILSGMVTTLSLLGMERKKAIVLKELVGCLVPALVQARKIGAAEAGIHPAASLSAVGASGALSGQLPSDDREAGVSGVLRELHGIYGAVECAPDSTDAQTHAALDNSQATDVERVINAVVAKATGSAAYQGFGSLNLKIDILRACIDFCEALPDPAGVVHFAAMLLRITGPNAAIDHSTSNRHVNLSAEEQNRLVSNMARMINASRKMGLGKVEADYWDDFLIRDVRCVEGDECGELIVHQKADLDSAQRKSKTPFLYDPFAKQNAEVEAKEKVFVAGEPFELVITLQNPFDLELSVETLDLVTDGISLTTQIDQLILGPARLQEVRLAATANTAGALKIIGCAVKVFGCKEQLFPIYQQAWSADIPLQIKQLGYTPRSRNEDDEQSSGTPHKKVAAPQSYSLPLTVIEAQPELILDSVSLSESALMVLEGERKSFRVVLRNTSRRVSVDFLHVGFEDSLTTSVRNALVSKEMSRAEMYDLELQLSREPIFRWHRVDGAESNTIVPGAIAVFEVSAIGRPGLGAARILFDYASLGKPSAEVEGRFFTRQIAVPIDITVNASIQLHRVDVLPFSNDFAWSNQHRQRLVDEGSADKQSKSLRSPGGILDKGGNRFHALLDRVGLEGQEAEHCLVLLDLRNAWPKPLSVSLEARENPFSSSSSTISATESPDDWKRAYTVHEVIHPGHIARLVLLLPRTYLSNPHAPIPLLSKQNERQYVVSTSRTSPSAERAAREQFWYRERILSLLRGQWREEGSDRGGDVALRGIRLTQSMVEAVKCDDVGISMRVETDDGSAQVQRLASARFSVSAETFLTLKTNIKNRSSSPIRAMLRLQPSLAHLVGDAALEVGKRVMWTGLLQQAIPLLKPREEREVKLGLCFLCPGDYEVGALVEETVPGVPAVDAADGEEDLEGRYLMLGRERRVWCVKEPCVMHVSAAQQGLEV